MTLMHKAGSITLVAIAPMYSIGYHLSRNDLAAVQTLTPPAGSHPRYLMMQAVDQNVRYTLTVAAAPSSPTATFGFQLVASSPQTIIPVDAGIVVRVIEEAATAVLQYQWFE